MCPQFSYDHPVAVNGQIAESGPRRIRSYLNALVAQLSTILWAGTTADGSYAVRIVGEEVDVTIAFLPGGVTTPDAVAVGITAAALASEDLINVVVVTDAVADTNELTFIHPDRVYTVTTIISAGGNGTGTVTETTAAGGTRIPLGVVAVQDLADGEARLPTVGDVSADAVGILVRNTDSEFNEGNPVLDDGFRPGSMLSAMQQGAAWVIAEVVMAVIANVFFRIASPTLAD